MGYCTFFLDDYSLFLFCSTIILLSVNGKLTKDKFYLIYVYVYMYIWEMLHLYTSLISVSMYQSAENAPYYHKDQWLLILHYFPNLWNHPSSVSVLLLTWWKSMSISTEARRQYLQTLLQVSDKVTRSTIIFSPVSLCLGNADFFNSHCIA